MKVITYGFGGFDPSKPNNNIVSETELPDFPQESLDPTGALATLLVVEGVLPIVDAANAVRLTPDDLVLEAQAWAAAAERTNQ